MVAMVPILLSLLLLLGPVGPKETQAGPYSLVFLYTGVSRRSNRLPRFQATAFLNDQAFFRYNSKIKKAEPLGPWSQMEGIEDWKTESQLQQTRGEIFLATLKDVMGYYKDRKGSHTFQTMFGCELWDNGRSGAFGRYAYDGQDFIEFYKEIPAWMPFMPAAVRTKMKWEAEEVYLQQAKAYLEKECPELLQRYLNYSRTHLDRQDPPSVSISSRMVPGGNRTLTCLAYDFYPRRIGLHWSRVRETQEVVSGGEVLPNGNGTYRSWVRVDISPEDRAPYFCHVEHSGLKKPLVLQWNKRQKIGGEGH